MKYTVSLVIAMPPDTMVGPSDRVTIIGLHGFSIHSTCPQSNRYPYARNSSRAHKLFELSSLLHICRVASRTPCISIATTLLHTVLSVFVGPVAQSAVHSDLRKGFRDGCSYYLSSSVTVTSKNSSLVTGILRSWGLVIPAKRLRKVPPEYNALREMGLACMAALESGLRKSYFCLSSSRISLRRGPLL